MIEFSTLQELKDYYSAEEKVESKQIVITKDAVTMYIKSSKRDIEQHPVAFVKIPVPFEANAVPFWNFKPGLEGYDAMVAYIDNTPSNDFSVFFAIPRVELAGINGSSVKLQVTKQGLCMEETQGTWLNVIKSQVEAFFAA